MQIQGYIPQLNTARVTNATPILPRNAFLFAQPTVAAPTDSFEPSEAAKLAGLRTPTQNLMLFGGDRKNAVETLIASGAKAENPKLGLFKDVMRKLVGGTKTSSKAISATQTIETKVKVKNFNLKALRLTTKGAGVGNEQTVRHVDFAPTAPTGKKAQVKDIGSVIAQGTPTRLIEQEIKPAGRPRSPTVISTPKQDRRSCRPPSGPTGSRPTKWV